MLFYCIGASLKDASVCRESPRCRPVDGFALPRGVSPEAAVKPCPAVKNVYILPPGGDAPAVLPRHSGRFALQNAPFRPPKRRILHSKTACLATSLIASRLRCGRKCFGKCAAILKNIYKKALPQASRGLCLLIVPKWLMAMRAMLFFINFATKLGSLRRQCGKPHGLSGCECDGIMVAVWRQS